MREVAAWACLGVMCLAWAGWAKQKGEPRLARISSLAAGSRPCRKSRQFANPTRTIRFGPPLTVASITACDA